MKKSKFILIATIMMTFNSQNITNIFAQNRSTINLIEGDLNKIEKKETISLGNPDWGYSLFSDIIEVSDGGVVAIGLLDSNIPRGDSTSIDAFIVKYDKNGNREWMDTIGGYGWEYFLSVTETKDGGILAVGSIESIDTVYPMPEHKSDAIIIKYSKTGEREWMNQFGGNRYEEFSTVLELYNGDILVGGTTMSPEIGLGSNGDNQAILVKYSPDGNQLWAKSYGGSRHDSFGYNDMLQVKKGFILELENGDIIVNGRTNSNDFGFENDDLSSDPFFMKIDKDGQQQWIRNINAKDGHLDNFFSDAISTADGGFITVGCTDGNDGYINNGSQDAVIVKFDSEGNRVWINNWGGKYNDEFNSMSKTNDGGYIAFGSTYKSSNSNFSGMVVKYDESGNEEWDLIIEGNSYNAFFSATATSDKGFIVAGYSDSTDLGFNSECEYGYDAIFIKYGYIKAIELVEIAESTRDEVDINEARKEVNKLAESSMKDELQDRLNRIFPNLTLESKTATANLDVYIKSKNTLLLSLDTNSVTFEDFSGVEDIENLNAVNLTINSSLPYKINAYLATEIQNSDKSKTMDKEILNIRASGSTNYNTFADTITPIVLLDNQPSGNDISHGIDLMLKGNIAHEKEVYKTVIRFEAEQK